MAPRIDTRYRYESAHSFVEGSRLVRIRVYEGKNGIPVVVCTRLPEQRGLDPLYEMRDLQADIIHRYLPERRRVHPPCVWIYHDPTDLDRDHGEERLTRVDFADEGSFRSMLRTLHTPDPDDHEVTRQWVEGLIGEHLSLSPFPLRRREDVVITDFEKNMGGSAGSEQRFRATRPQFERFVDAWVFNHAEDAQRAGFSRLVDVDGVRLPIGPRLVLRDELGQQLWLSECTAGYGGQGPGASARVLDSAGFRRELLEAVHRYPIVRLAQCVAANGQWSTVPFQKQYDLPRARSEFVFVVDPKVNHSQLLYVQRWQKEYFDPGLSLAEKCQLRERLSVPNRLREATVFLNEVCARDAGYTVHDGDAVRTFNVVLRASNEVQLWISTPDAGVRHFRVLRSATEAAKLLLRGARGGVDFAPHVDRVLCLFGFGRSRVTGRNRGSVTLEREPEIQTAR